MIGGLMDHLAGAFGLANPGGAVNLSNILESSRTNRVNESHFASATDTPINTVIANTLDTVRGRVAYEILNNPILSGMVKTFVDDLVGPDGPTIDIDSPSDEYNAGLLHYLNEWWTSPDLCDLNGELTGPDHLKLGIRQVLQTGDMIWQLATARPMDLRSPISLRIHAIHPRRLATPWAKVGSGNVAMGVERNANGRPEAYYIEEEDGELAAAGAAKRVPAKDIIHIFERLEPNQIRGLPRLQAALNPAAELRDYDATVMDAARVATMLAVLLYTTSDEVAHSQWTAPSSLEIQRSQMTTLPPGWQASQVTPANPPPIYSEFRRERLKDVGRAICMPLQTVQLDSTRHNYSSARMDRQGYTKNIRAEQAVAGRLAILRVIFRVGRELEVARLIPPRPAEGHVMLTWPVFEHVDPLKEANAARVRLESQITSRTQEAAHFGVDHEDTVIQRKRERDAMVGAEEPAKASSGGTNGTNGKGKTNEA